MSFLPFVLSFLIILVIGSMTFFTSYRSTLLQKKIIVANQSAKLQLICEHSMAEYKEKKIKEEKDLESSQTQEKPPPTQKKNPKQKEYKDKRSVRLGLDSSKMNLWPLLANSDPAVNTALYGAACRLIDLLYREADFYSKDLGEKLLNEMIEQKKESFLDFFPRDKALAKIYYKMAIGTNTGYPSLQEYFKIEKGEKQPIQYAYATTPILKAIFGEELTEKIRLAEKTEWEKNSRIWALSEQQLRDLLNIHRSPSFEINQLSLLFTFNRKDKGVPHTLVDESTPIRAIR